MNINHKILKAIDNNKLSLKNEGERNWYNFKVRITFLYWQRNLFDGYLIEVYEKYSNIHIGTVRYPES